MIRISSGDQRMKACCSLRYSVMLKATDVSRLSHARTTHSFIAILGLVNGGNLAIARDLNTM